MANKLRSNNPLGYLGTDAPEPPNVIRINRAPTANDYEGYDLGDMWINTASEDLPVPTAPTINDTYILTSKNRQIATATWRNLGSTLNTGIDQLTAASGTNPVVGDANHNVNLVGANVVTTVASANTVTVQVTQGTNGQVILGATGADPVWSDLASTDGSITFTPGAGTLDLQVANTTYTAEPLRTLINLTDSFQNVGAVLANGAKELYFCAAASALSYTARVSLDGGTTTHFIITDAAQDLGVSLKVNVAVGAQLAMALPVGDGPHAGAEFSVGVLY